MRTYKNCVLILLVAGVTINFSKTAAQFDDVKGCISAIKVPDLAYCFAGKFIQLIDGLNISLPFSQTPSYVTELEEIIKSYDSNQRQSSVMPTVAYEGGADSVLLKMYFKKLNREATNAGSRPPGREDSIPTLTDIFEDMLTVLKQTESAGGQSEHSDSIESALIATHLNRFRQRSKQLLTGRFLPAVKEMLGHRLVTLDQLFKRYSAEELSYTRAGSVEELLRIAKCLGEKNEEDFEDGLSWLKCLFVCKDLPFLSSCMVDLMSTTGTCRRVSWIGDMVIRLFTDYMELSNCYFDIISSPEELTEGGSTEMFEFRSFMPPGVHCFPPNLLSYNLRKEIVDRVFKVKDGCKVVMRVTTTNYIYNILPYVSRFNVGVVRCQNGKAINQIAIGWHEHAQNASGIIPLTMENWNSTFRLPLTAVIDHKDERPFNITSYPWNSTVQFTLKFKVDSTRMNTTKIPITVFDTDLVEPATCQSINDPHILTFDRMLYDNYYHGYFQFYKHHTLPYEVQVAYQACNESSTKQSCTCAVAVRSGDDVFVVDKCRLHANYCSEESETCRQMRVALYLNGNLTPGTRIYQLYGGLGYQVILPHGGILKVLSNGNLLNVWFTPSNYDLNKTSGLCGTYDRIDKNDFVFPNGTLCDSRSCPTASDSVSQPVPFIKAWRLDYNDTIFHGAVPMLANESFMSSNFCRCSHNFHVAIQCVCGFGELVETCDIAQGTELSPSNLSALFQPSLKSDGLTYPVDRRDFDLTYQPTNPTCTNPRVCYVTDCRKMLSKNELVGKVLIALPSYFQNFCIQDSKIFGSSSIPIDWELSSLEAAKVWIDERIQRSTNRADFITDRNENSTCFNECYYRGNCTSGTCVCEAPYTGADCSQLIDKQAVTTDAQTSCDVRKQNCSFATVYGNRFTDDGSLKCNVQRVKILPDETNNPASLSKVDIFYVSPNQVACHLPSSGYSYEISVVQTSKSSLHSIGQPFTLITYDSVCYSCDTSTKNCWTKNDGSYCLINGKCYAHMQRSSYDECSLCNITETASRLTDSQELKCVEKRLEEQSERDRKQRETDIRIIVSASLSSAIVLITIVAFFYQRRQEKLARQQTASTTDHPDSDSFNGSEEMSDTIGGTKSRDVVKTSDYQQDTFFGQIPAFDLTPTDDVDKTNPEQIENVVVNRPWDSHSLGSQMIRSRMNSITSIRSTSGLSGTQHMSKAPGTGDDNDDDKTGKGSQNTLSVPGTLPVSSVNQNVKL